MIITVTAFNGYSRRAWEHKPRRRRGTARERGHNHRVWKNIRAGCISKSPCRFGV